MMEGTGAVTNVGTSLFIVLLALVITGCVALILNAALTGTSNLTAYLLSTGFDNHPNGNLATVILGILVILHGFGYYCQYVKTPLNRCHLWLLVTGSLTLLVAVAAVLVVTRGQQLGLEPIGYYNTALIAMQLATLMAFAVCMCKSGCFGKCNSNARLVFYVVVGIYAVWLLAYLAACAAYAVLHNKVSRGTGGLDPYDKLRQSYRRIPCANYVLLIALTLSAYQVNFCCVPITGTDWTFLLLFGICAGILLSVAMHYRGGNALHNPVPYILCALAAGIMAVLLMYSYFKEPFAQMVPDKKYTPWDLVFIALAVVLAVITMALLIKWKAGSESGEDWIRYTLPPVMVVCIAIELGMLHFGWVRGSSCGIVWQAILVILVLKWVATFAMVVIEVCGGGMYIGTGSEPMFLLLVLHLVLSVATVLVCHYHMPFPGKHKLWNWSIGLWDAVLVLLVLESIVTLVLAVVRVYQGDDHDNGCYTLVTLDAIVCGTALGIVYFKEPFSQYWPRDRLACGVLSLVSLVTWLGVASCHDKLSSKISTELDAKVYCLVAYGILTFGGALYYGFRSGVAQGSCFSKKSTGSSTQLQGSEEAVSSIEGTVDGIEDTVDVTGDTE